MEQKIKLHLANGSFDLFKIRESGGRYYVYGWKNTGVFSDNYEHIGDARDEDDAIRIMKANASGRVTRISYE